LTRVQGRTLDAWRLVAAALPEDLHFVVAGNLGRARPSHRMTLRSVTPGSSAQFCSDQAD